MISEDMLIAGDEALFDAMIKHGIDLDLDAGLTGNEIGQDIADYVFTKMLEKFDEYNLMIETLDKIGGMSSALRVGGPDCGDLQSLSDTLREAVDMANQAISFVE